ncbi:MAG: fibro-slime domain-containing protein [Planctomycetota bacterium]
MEKLEERRLLAAFVAEAEQGQPGQLWEEHDQDTTASGSTYIEIAPGNNSTSSAPGTDGIVSYDFTLDTAGDYVVWGRVRANNGNDDSFWVQVDGSAWARWNTFPSTGNWEWDDVHDSSGTAVTYTLSAGQHTLRVGYREDGAQLDKLVVQESSAAAPTGLGPAPTVPVDPGAGSGPTPTTILTADFESGADGFEYVDDAFEGTSQPSYASGILATGEGADAGDVLRVDIGGIDGTAVAGMSGAWQEDFEVVGAGDSTLTLSYRLDAGAFASGETVRLLAMIDGREVGSGPLATHAGGSGASDTGWVTTTIDVGTLLPGTHRLQLGLHANAKSSIDGQATAWFDDVELALAEFGYDAADPIVIAPSDDTSVSGGAPTSGDELDVRYSAANYGDHQTLLQFDLSGAGLPTSSPDAIHSATLWLWGEGDSDPVSIEARAISDAWDEATVTYSNKPDTSGPASSASYVDHKGWHAWDITGLVRSELGGDDTVSVALIALENRVDRATFNSSDSDDASLHPRLVVETDPEAVSAALDTSGSEHTVQVTFADDIRTTDAEVTGVMIENLTLGGQLLARPGDPVLVGPVLSVAPAQEHEWTVGNAGSYLPDGNYEVSLFGRLGGHNDNVYRTRDASGELLFFYNGDFDNDRVVEQDDLNIVIASINTPPAQATYATGDVNGDGVVDVLDHELVQSRLNTSLAAPPSGPGDLTLGSQTRESVTLNWGVPATYDGFEVWRRGEQGAWQQTTLDNRLSDTSFHHGYEDGIATWVDTALLPGTRYEYFVRPFTDAAGSGEASNVNAAWTSLPGVTGVTVTQTGRTANDMRINFTSTPIGDDVQVRIESYDEVEDEWVLAGTADATSADTGNGNYSIVLAGVGGDVGRVFQVRLERDATGLASGTTRHSAWSLPVRAVDDDAIVSIPVTFRDFKPLGSGDEGGVSGHVDFSSGRNIEDAVRYGLVADQLGPDGKPVFRDGFGWKDEAETIPGNDGGTEEAILSAASFASWYNDDPTLNRSTTGNLLLRADDPNRPDVFRLVDNTFFPLDGQLLVNSPFNELTDDGTLDGRPHNFGHTFELHAQITYAGPGSGETLTFEGDDDIWVFIDGQLVVDLGGQHHKEAASVDLDSLGLAAGTYDFDLFYAERNPGSSHFKMEVASLLLPEPGITGAATVNEGHEYDLLLVNGADDWSIDWGDGRTETVGSGNNVTATHVYADDAVGHTITATTLDADGATHSFTQTVAVTNVAPADDTPAPLQPILHMVTAGTANPFTELVKFNDPGFLDTILGTDETFVATIDWDDGSTADPGTVTITRTGSAGVATLGVVSGSHLYAASGTYNGTVTVTDDDGAATPIYFAVEAMGPTPPADVLLIEETRLLTSTNQPGGPTASASLVVPSNPAFFRFDYSNLFFDSGGSNPEDINDAFELLLNVGSGDTPLPTLGTTSVDASAQFNLTQTQIAALADGTGHVVNDSSSGSIYIDGSSLTPGSTVEVVARLLNNDADNGTSVTLRFLADDANQGKYLLPPEAVTASPLPASRRDGSDGSVLPLQRLSDATRSFETVYGHTAYDAATGRLSTYVNVSKTSSLDTRGEALIAVRRIRAQDAGGTVEGVAVDGYDGLLQSDVAGVPAGTPFYRITNQVTSDADGLHLAGPAGGRVISFTGVDSADRFDFDVVVLAELNLAPEIVSDPHTEQLGDAYVVQEVISSSDGVVETRPNLEIVANGNTEFVYPLRGLDPNADDIEYAKIVGPTGMTIAAEDTDGDGIVDQHVLRWIPTAADAGTWAVRLRATDSPFGLSDPALDQHFSITAVTGVVNRPPTFTSTPPSIAYVGEEYVYQATAKDPDGDPLDFGKISPEDSGAITSGGLFTWTPSPDLAGQTADFAITVTDSINAPVPQHFTVEVIGTGAGEDVDLSISNVDVSGLKWDPQTLTVTGVVSAEATTSNLAYDASEAEIVFFEDRNYDGVFNGDDSRLGTLPLGQFDEPTKHVAATVLSSTSFAGAAVSAYIDYQNVTPEVNEHNNLAVSTDRCGVVLEPALTWNPVVSELAAGRYEFVLNQGAQNETWEQEEFASTPLIADLDNDGSLEFIATKRFREQAQSFGGSAALVIGDVETGAILYHSQDSLPLGMGYNTTFGADPAVADLDLDGRLEVIFASATGDEGDNIYSGDRLFSVELDASGSWITSEQRVPWYRDFDAGAGGADLRYGLYPQPELAIATANVDDDPEGEIVIGFRVFEHDLSPKTQDALDISSDGSELDAYASTGSNHRGPVSTVADVIDTAGFDGPEIILGNAVRAPDGAEVWRHFSLPNGYTAVSDFGTFNDTQLVSQERDGVPEIVLVGPRRTWIDEAAGPNLQPVGDSTVLLLNGQSGRVIWESAFPIVTEPDDYNDNEREGGPPTIGDFDGDGVPEVAVAGAGAIVIFESDGEVAALLPTQDLSSGTTGSTSFDFDNDGRVELIYGDELFVRVMALPGSNPSIHAGTGKPLLTELFRVSRPSGTLLEVPVVADVDNDGAAEIVFAANREREELQALRDWLDLEDDGDDTNNSSESANFDVGNGLYIIDNASGSWAPTAAIWNQNSYHVTNVNQVAPGEPGYGQVPVVEQPSWETHNSYRLNTQPRLVPGVGIPAPDLIPSFARIDRVENTVTIRIGNGGSASAPAGTPIAVFDGQPGPGATQIAVALTTNELAPNSFEDVILQLSPGVDPETVWIRADWDQTDIDIESHGYVRECDGGGEANNLYSVAQGLTPLPENSAPVLTGSPETTMRYDESYAFTPTVTDADAQDVHAFDLLEGPEGLFVDALSGAVTWSPTRSDIGLHSVVLRVRDGRGGSDLMAWSIRVNDNLPPEIISAPVAPDDVWILTTDDPFEIHIEARDLDDVTGQLLDFQVSGPSEVVISGIAPATPTSGVPGAKAWSFDLEGSIATADADAGRSRSEYEILVRVSDGESAVVHPFTLHVVDPPPDNAPPIPYHVGGSLIAAPDLPFYAEFTAWDPDGGPLDYTLTRVINNQGVQMPDVPGLGPVTVESGEAARWSWTPSLADITREGDLPYLYRLSVADQEHSVQLPFTLEFRVVERWSNSAPTIQSDGSGLRSIDGDPLYYQALATDPDEDTLTWSIESGPSSAFIEPDTGLFSWYPDPDDGPLDVYEARIVVDDGMGGVDSQTISFSVSRSNTSPDIVSLPPQPGLGGETWQYLIEAEDAEQDALVFEYRALNQTPDQYDDFVLEQQSPTTALLTWENPPGATMRNFEIIVREDRPNGLSGSQRIKMTTGAAAQDPPNGDPDTPLQLIGEPISLIEAGSPYSYQLVAEDPDGPVTFALVSSEASWLSMNASGLLSADASDTVAGSYDVVVSASQGPVLLTMGYTLVVTEPLVPNQPPVIDGPIAHSIAAGAKLEFGVTATDPEELPLTFSLLENEGDVVEWARTPLGIAIDPSGNVTWDVPYQIATPNVQMPVIRVRDAGGLVADLKVTISVVPPADDAPPTAQLFSSADAVDQGRSVTFSVTAEDDYGVLGRYVEIETAEWINNDDLPLRLPTNAYGQVTYNIPADAVMNSQLSTTFGVRGFAVDTAGRTTASALKSITVFDPTNIGDPLNPQPQPPRLGIADVAEGEPGFYPGMLVDEMVTVRGYAFDPNDDLTSFSVVARRASGEEVTIEKQLATPSQFVPNIGDPEIDADLFTINPLLLANGPWSLEVSVTDSSGGAAQTAFPVEIATPTKVGNFAMTFTDLQAEVGALPLTVTRTYDSYRSGEVDGDFGPGWNLDITSGQLRVEHDGDGSGDAFGLTGGYVYGTPINVTLPNGRELSYDTVLLPIPNGSAGGAVNLFRVAFRPRPGSEDVLLELASDRFAASAADAEDSGFAPYLGYYPALLAQDPSLNSWQVFLDDTDNKLYTDPTRALGWNPAILEAQGIDFQLRSFTGEEYVYDSESGSILSMTDRLGNEMTFDNDGDIISTKDVSGTKLAELRVKRDSDKRIEQIQLWSLDENGAFSETDQVSYSYGSNGSLASFTNRNSDVVEYFYDEAWNASGGAVDVDGVPGQDALGRPGFLTRVRDDDRGVDTLKVLFWSADDVDLPSPDHVGMLKGLVDADGNAAGFGYELDGSLIPGLPASSVVEIVADADGAETHVVRDGQGNVIRQIQQTGDETFLVTAYEYDDTRQTKSFRPFEADRSVMYDFDPAVTPLSSETTYGDTDHPDLPTRVVDAAGVWTEYEYDASGQPRIIRTATGSTINSYNANGTVRRTTDALGNATAYAYDAQNNLELLTRFDAAGREIEFGRYTYDNRGLLTQAEDATGNVTTFGYDFRGRQTFSERTTLSSADQALVDSGQSTVPPTTVRNETAYDNGGRVRGTKQFVDGVLIYETATTYDAAGRVLTSEDRYGHVTTTRYDARGNVVETRSPADDTGGNDVIVVTRTAYDANGRAIATTDPFVTKLDGTLVLPDGTDAPLDNSHLRVTHTLYDPAGRVVETRRLEGLEIPIVPPTNGSDVWETTFDYEPATDGNPDNDTYGGTPLTSVLLSKTSTTYDVEGRTATTTSATGLVTETLYDAFGRQEGSRYDLDLNQDGMIGAGETIESTQTYDAAGRVDVSTGPLGRQSRNTYDALGRVTVSTLLGDTPALPSDDVVTRTEYDELGRQSAAIDALGRRTEYEYDDAGRLMAVTLPPIDPDGSATGTADLRRPRYEYHYDQEGRQTHIVQNAYLDVSSNEVVYLTADGTGTDSEHRRSANQPIAQWPKDQGHVTTFTYDAQGRQLSRTLPMGNVAGATAGSFTEYKHYDATPGVGYGRLTHEVDFEGRVTAYTHDDTSAGRGRMTSMSYYDSEADHAAGTASRTVGYTYDALGRRVEVDDSQFLVPTTYAHDAEGRLTTIDSPQGLLHYGYDDLGRKTSAWTDHADPQQSTTLTEYGYDQMDRLIRVDTVRRFGQAVDTDTTLSGDQPESTRYVYDAAGMIDHELLGVADGEQVVKDYGYDSLGRVEGLTHFVDLDGDFSHDSGTETRLASFVYTHEDGGSPASEVWTDEQGRVTTKTWTYDGLNRLATETYAGFDASGTPLAYADSFTYDLTGNRLSLEHVETTGTTGGSHTTTYTYDAGDRLLVEERDTDGDGSPERTTTYGYGPTVQTQKVVTGDETSTTTFGYDASGRMTSVSVDGTSVEYKYDHSGFRVERTEGGTTTIYHVDPSNPTGYAQAVEEGTDGDGDRELDAAEVTHAFTLAMSVVAQAVRELATGDIDVHRLLMDAHGSTRAVLDAETTPDALAVLQRLAYTAYGQDLGLTSPLTAFRYAGQAIDPLTGQSYNRARWYETGTGRFNRVDPWAGSSQRPLTLNKYGYTHASPTIGVDPTGESLYATLLGSLTVRAGIYAASIGAGLGAAFGAADSLLQGKRGMDVVYDMFIGAAFGAVLGPLTLTVLGPFVAGLGLGAGAYGTWSAIDEENYELAAFRGLSTVFGAYTTYRAYVPTSSGTLSSTQPSQLRFSQRTAGGGGNVTDGVSRAFVWRNYLRRFGFDGVKPVDVVDTPDGLVAIDNTRAAIAAEQGIASIPVRIHKPGDALPSGMISVERFGSSKTWGEALAYRTARNRLPENGTLQRPKLPQE